MIPIKDDCHGSTMGAVVGIDSLSGELRKTDRQSNSYRYPNIASYVLEAHSHRPGLLI